MNLPSLCGNSRNFAGYVQTVPHKLGKIAGPCPVCEGARGQVGGRRLTGQWNGLLSGLHTVPFSGVFTFTR